MPRNTTISFNHTSLNNPRPRSPGLVFLGSPFFYADNPAAVQTPPPQVFIVQPTAAPDLPPETKPEPLLIELRGNRYVRSGERGVNVPPDYSEVTRPIQHAAQSERPSAVLIFHDGHREQVREYVIVSGVLYAQEDYWQHGRWTRNIRLSTLDIPATATANRENGVKFMLPSAPNEVVTRP
jgi:hypothetical protein